MNNLPGLTDNRKRNSTGLFSPSIMRIFLCGLVSICVALPPEKIFSACKSQAAHAQRQISFSCVCNSSCVCMPLPSSKCRQGRGSKSVFLQSTKEEEKEKKQQPKCKTTISGCTRSNSWPHESSVVARSDELTQTFAASILEFCNLPLDATRLCINFVLCAEVENTHEKETSTRSRRTQQGTDGEIVRSVQY